MKTITGEEINVKANHSKRTFTIRESFGTFKAKYRTYPMSKDEFRSCLHNTANDWMHFLKSSDYYKVK